ncbi:hypothetical protein [Ornithinimicrobium kibberense]|uniref:hypothetical protein n=1 Tax=Ornithinimicrobium kibberense TaxID=282060 RepID=UPI00360CCE25
MVSRSISSTSTTTCSSGATVLQSCFLRRTGSSASSSLALSSRTATHGQARSRPSRRARTPARSSRSLSAAEFGRSCSTLRSRCAVRCRRRSARGTRQRWKRPPVPSSGG